MNADALAAEHPLRRLLHGDPPWIMGVLNVTPDSFSDGGVNLDPAAALESVAELRSAGAAIVDIGGESTRPGSAPVPAAEELRRIESVVAAAASGGVLSIDTYKATVAAHCLELGARVINDVSALRADRDLARVVAEHRAFVVLMQSKEAADHPHATESAREYKNVVAEICDFFKARIDAALAAGISADRIILDPGFGKFVSHDPRYSWEILERFAEFLRLGFPLLAGISRKGFLGGRSADRDALSAFASMLAAERGAVIIRMHDAAMAASFIAAARETRFLK